MDVRSFDRLARNSAAGVSRRTTLMALGAAGLTALVGPFAAEAKKGGQKKNKKKSNAPVPAPLECPPAPQDRCPAQVATCKSVLGAECDGSPTCTDELPCCDLLETCNASGFWACLLATSG